ncbi:MAG: hypothetical protein K1X63_04825 [Chitinophagales bacterium]|nr:hypothetical protein [Chitinophagales bacterium]
MSKRKNKQLSDLQDVSIPLKHGAENLSRKSYSEITELVGRHKKATAARNRRKKSLVRNS